MPINQTTVPPAGDAYQRDRADAYLSHHRKSLRNRLTSDREIRLLYRALVDAGRPESAIDIPCGAGRFWPAFQAAGVRRLWAFDASENMLRVAAEQTLSPNLPARLEPMSAFAITLADKSVDFSACMRFYHHLARAEDRLLLLEQLARITRGHVALSLWVDGNFGGWRRMRRQSTKEPVATAGYGRRLCQTRAMLEAEFREANLKVVQHYDVWPRIAMWRLYLLRVPQSG